MNVKELFLGFGKFKVNNGGNTRFWKDVWIGNTPLKNQYAYLYRIVRHKNATVASVFTTVPLNISFRRSLLGDNLQLWHNLVAEIASVTLNDSEGIFKWGLNQNGAFNVRSMYNAMITGNIWENMFL
jgi:hypothetical protein